MVGLGTVFSVGRLVIVDTSGAVVGILDAVLAVGDAVRKLLTEFVLCCVGAAVGELVAIGVVAVGIVSRSVDAEVGVSVGDVGVTDGSTVGCVGVAVGTKVGPDGCMEGTSVGCVGTEVGLNVGLCVVGDTDGTREGMALCTATAVGTTTVNPALLSNP